MAFQLPELGYDYNALEPHIDAQTMEIHYTKHHQGYTNKLNDAIAGTEMDNQTIEQILQNCDMNNAALRNNAGGYYNHCLYWEIMKQNGGGQPSGPLSDAINNAFGNFDAFKEQFKTAGTGRFGSGWAWLSVKNGGLVISSTPNQDNPLMPGVGDSETPILGMDVWEHAYYLNYQNKRGDYIDAFFEVIDWEEVGNKYDVVDK